MLSVPPDLVPGALKRWLAKVDTSGGPDACHPWTAGCFDSGYGAFRIGPKLLKAHRAGWMLLVGPIPPDIDVCHSCDNPPCQNRGHWFLGTTQDNTADRHAKGRDAKGTDNGGFVIAKLSEADRTAIRRRYQAGEMTQDQLAGLYGVSQKTISNLLRKARYAVRDTNAPVIAPPPEWAGRGRSKLTPEVRDEIDARHRAGETQTAIARAVGISQGAVSKHLNGIL